jgi:hypothetical protein
MSSCRKCGNEMEVYCNCHVCKKPIEFICQKCDQTTTKEIHSNYMIEKMQESLQVKIQKLLLQQQFMLHV